MPCDPLLRISSTRVLASISHSYRIEQLSVSAIPTKWRLLRISAAVAQEEVAVTAEVDAGSVEEEDKEGEEVILDGEADQGPVGTKLYFGNLPYSVDSAQLAGIIQDFGSPELIEVFSIQYFLPKILFSFVLVMLLVMMAE
jgi:hypothetical protein